MITGPLSPARCPCALTNRLALFAPVRFFFWFLAFFLLTILSHPISAQVEGVIYRDHDRNGQQSATGSAPLELGIPGVTVLVYVDGITTPFSTTTGFNGSFGFTAGTIGPAKKIRLEYSGLPAYTYETPLAPGSGGARFLTTPAQVAIGLNDPAEYCQAQPMLVTPLYRPGGLQPDAANVVSFSIAASGQQNGTDNVPGPMAAGSNAGSVWATAYQRQSQRLLTTSFLKRHAALGNLGLGGLYVTDVASATTTPYLDLDTYLTLASGADQTTLTARTLPASFSTASTDAAIFSLIGKVGLGGATFTPTEDKLWVVNLHTRSLVSIGVGAPLKPAAQITAADFTSYAIPQSVTTGVGRPWAVAYHHGKLYVGVVNDASVTKRRADLSACVYAFDLQTNTFATTPVLTIPLTYRKGWAFKSSDAEPSLGEFWEPWSDTWADFSTNVLNAATTPAIHRVARPQPILSSIGFDAEGAMLIGLMDRSGHQLGRLQPAPTNTAPTATTVYSGYTGGDLLRAALVGNTYLAERNGSAGGHSGCGVANGQGPTDNLGQGGEFYCLDTFSPGAALPASEETFTGSLLSNPSLNDLLVSVFNPFTTWSAGVSTFNMLDASLLNRFEVYQDAAGQTITSPRSTFGATNGLGQLSALCQAPDVEIGSRVWVDTNGDGVQGPAEPTLPGVTLSLHASNGQRLTTTTSDAQGRYVFRGGTNLILPYQSTYFIAIGAGPGAPQYNTTKQVLRLGDKSYRLAGWNQGIGTSPDQNDSDAFLLTGSTSATALNGYPVMQFRLVAPGQTITSLDVGLREAPNCPDNQTCLQITAQRIR